jgi:two-component system response regulator RegA
MSASSVTDRDEHSLVLIDDDVAASRHLASAFERHGWRVDHYPRCPDPRCVRASPRYVAVDICPNGLPVLSTVRQARRCYPRSYLVALTAYPSVMLAVRAVRHGADDCMIKPLEPSQLLGTGSVADGDSADVTAALPSLAKIEWEYLSRVLMMHDGNISSTARALGIQRSTLQRKLRKYPPAR